jgi:tryptophan 2-monooxygenase
MNAPEFLSRTLPYIDTLYDYGAFLARTGGHLGTLPADGARDARIAIVGAGVGGLVAACELLRAGARQLVVFEANPARVGGRLLSQSINPDHPHLLAEMGAMRFPPSQAALYHYLERFGIDSSSTFPDPGVVDTEIHYQGHAYRWPAGERPPALFDRVDRGWRAFIRDGVRLDDGTQLPAPAELTALLRAHCYDDARRGWQQYIDRFGDESFYSAIVKIFTGATPPGGVRWRRSEDLRLFGTLGIGSGGFQPVYRASFLEILRIVVNELEVDQRLIPAGIFALAQRLLDDGGQAARVRDRVVRGRAARREAAGRHLRADARRWDDAGVRPRDRRDDDAGDAGRHGHHRHREPVRARGRARDQRYAHGQFVEAVRADPRQVLAQARAAA